MYMSSLYTTWTQASFTCACVISKIYNFSHTFQKLMTVNEETKAEVRAL